MSNVPNPNRRDALRTVAALALSGGAAAAPVALARAAAVTPPVVEADKPDDYDDLDDYDGVYVSMPNQVLMNVEHLDPDIVTAAWREQQRLIPELVRLRARKEWDRLRGDGEEPKLITDEHGETHWMVDGLTNWYECCACGQDTSQPSDNGHTRHGKPSCLDCRVLLRGAKRGDAARGSLRRPADRR